MGIDLSAGTGFTEESGTNAYHSFKTTSIPLSFGKTKAINPGSGRSPVSRRLLYALTPLRFRMDSVLSMRMRYESWAIRSQIASAMSGLENLSCQPGTSN